MMYVIGKVVYVQKAGGEGWRRVYVDEEGFLQIVIVPPSVDEVFDVGENVTLRVVSKGSKLYAAGGAR